MTAPWSRGEKNSECVVPTGLNGVAAIAAGGFHSLIRKNDGTVVAWGDHSWGQRTVPNGLSNVVAIAAGTNSLALTAEGWWWRGARGMVPTGLNGVVAIAAGFSQSGADADGRVVAWGENSTPVRGAEGVEQRGSDCGGRVSQSGADGRRPWSRGDESQRSDDSAQRVEQRGGNCGGRPSQSGADDARSGGRVGIQF